MSDGEADIVEFLAGKAKAAWDDPENSRPYLLSFTGPDFREAGINYQSALIGERLKAFVERTEGENSYRVVKHPTQSAKIGLVPWGVDFQFEDVGTPTARARDRQDRHAGQGSILIEFLNALSALPERDLEGMVIPARVLVKLAKKK
ncbi:MAG TPA: hypothetical protein VF489_06325 [Sphingobium sp.]